VDQWFAETWPLIQREAKREKARVYFGDESNIRTDYHRGTTWGVKGETPVIEKTGKRYGVNLISAVSPAGKLRFMVTDQRVNADVFIGFLKRLLHKAERPVYLVLDGHPVHRSKKVKEFVEKTDGKLKLFYLPPYSPELNPDELVWNHVKAQKLGRQVIKTKDELMERTRSILRSLQKNSEKLMAFFREENVKYILADVL
jgi:transposase